MSKVIASYLVKVVIRDEEDNDVHPVTPPTIKGLENTIEAAISGDLDDLAPEYITVSAERTDQ